MNDKKTNNSFWGGILGGLIVSWTNLIMQQHHPPEEDNWDIQDFFMDYTGAYMRKKDGYKLKYDIDQSKIIPKYVNISKPKDWLVEISVDKLRICDDIEFINPEIYHNILDSRITRAYEKSMYTGLVIFNNPKYWIYSVNTDDYLTIIISNCKMAEYHDINNYDYTIEKVHEVFLCLDLNEVNKLTNEMKKYYHNYYDRVKIQESIIEEKELNSKYKHWLYDIIPHYDKMIENIASIETYPFNEIIKILDNNKLINSNQLIYTLFSITNLLWDDYLSKAEIHLEYLLEINENILKKSKVLKKLLNYIIEIYIELKNEEKLIVMIKKYYMDDPIRLSYLAHKFDDSNTNLYDAATFAFERLVEIENNSYLFDLYLLYVKTNNIDKIRIMREKLKPGDAEPWITDIIDKYLIK